LRCYKLASVLSPEDVGLQDKIHRMELQLSRGDFDASPSRMESSLEVKSTHFNDTSSAISQSPNISNEALMTELAGEDFEEESVVAQSPADTMAQIESFKNNDLSGLDVSSLDESDSYREDSEESEMRRAKIDAILGFEEESGDSYKTENVSQVFAEEVQSSPEITTQTLGDLYYSQGQYEKSLKIFEKLQRTRPSVELSHKIQQCRSQLGVDSVSLKRQQKIDALNAILNKNRNNR
jgi:tetratricopeptide (TPR) repeat protein